MNLTERLNDLRGLSKADVLAAIGLATKPSATQRLLGSLSIFGIGLLVGAGTALLLAPKTGGELREDPRTAIPEAPRGARRPGGLHRQLFIGLHGRAITGRNSHLNCGVSSPGAVGPGHSPDSLRPA